MDPFRVLAVVGCGLLLSTAHLSAQRHDRVVPIVELTDADLSLIDLHDASTADWAAVLGATPTLQARDFHVVNGYAPYDPADLNYGIWLGWHDATNRIYGAIERVDDVNLDESDGDPAGWWQGDFWFQDSIVQLQIDGDARGGNHEWFSINCSLGPSCESLEERNARRDAANRELQWYWLMGDLRDSWRKVFLVENGFQYEESWFEEPPYADSGGGHFGGEPVIDVTEFYVTPFDLLVWDDRAASVVTDLTPGGVILLRFILVDRDLPRRSGFPHTVHTFPRLLSLNFSEDDSREYAHAILLSAGSLSPVSDVPVSAWARVKALQDDRSAGRRDP